MPADLYLVINDLKVENSCDFIVYFNQTLEVCDKYWGNVNTFQVPREIQEADPQFITVPELYQIDHKNLAVVPHYFCDQLWNNNVWTRMTFKRFV